jgi:preprotein translocase subunit SecB
MSENQPQNNAAPQFSLRAQYVKDLSFENPKAPLTLLPQQEKPAISFNIDINVTRLSDDAFEVALHTVSKAEIAGETMFLVDLTYAGLFNVQNIPQENFEPLLFIECPHIIFPFARRIIADATRDGGFPPLLLEPIDFARLYQLRKQQQAA